VGFLHICYPFAMYTLKTKFLPLGCLLPYFIKSLHRLW
jgi:hypothetical protein